MTVTLSQIAPVHVAVAGPPSELRAFVRDVPVVSGHLLQDGEHHVVASFDSLLHAVQWSLTAIGATTLRMGIDGDLVTASQLCGVAVSGVIVTVGDGELSEALQTFFQRRNLGIHLGAGPSGRTLNGWAARDVPFPNHPALRVTQHTALMIPMGVTLQRPQVCARLSALRDNGARVVAIVGGPGVGKTTEALQAIKRWSLESDGDLQTRWVNLAECSSLADVLAATSRDAVPGLDCSPVQTPDDSHELVAGLGMAFATSREMVLLLDGAERVVDLLEAIVHAWLGRAPNLTVLVTSQIRPRSGWLAGAQFVLSPFRIEQTAEFVGRELPDEATRRLHEAVGGHPAALSDIAGHRETAELEELAAIAAQPALWTLLAEAPDVDSTTRLGESLGRAMGMLPASAQGLLRAMAPFEGGFNREMAVEWGPFDATTVEERADARHGVLQAALDAALRHHLLIASTPIEAGPGRRGTPRRFWVAPILARYLAEVEGSATGPPTRGAKPVKGGDVAVDTDQLAMQLLQWLRGRSCGEIAEELPTLRAWLVASPEAPWRRHLESAAIVALNALQSDDLRWITERVASAPLADELTARVRASSSLSRWLPSASFLARVDGARSLSRRTLRAELNAAVSRGDLVRQVSALVPLALTERSLESARERLASALAATRALEHLPLMRYALWGSALVECGARNHAKVAVTLHTLHDTEPTVGNGAMVVANATLDDVLTPRIALLRVLVALADADRDAGKAEELKAAVAALSLNATDAARDEADPVLGRIGRLTGIGVRLARTIATSAEQTSQDAATELLEASKRIRRERSSAFETLAARLLNRGFSGNLAPARGTGVASHSVLHTANGTWFRLPDGAVVDFGHRPLLARLVRHLLERRGAAPGTPVPSAEMLKAGWPFPDGVTTAALRNRLYVAIREMRTSGLEGLLCSDRSGYWLDDQVSFVRTDSAGQ